MVHKKGALQLRSMTGGRCRDYFSKGKGRALFFRSAQLIRSTFLKLETRTWFTLAALSGGLVKQTSQDEDAVQMAREFTREYIELRKLRGFANNDERISTLTQALYLYQNIGDKKNEAVLKKEIQSVLVSNDSEEEHK
jgi:hypothetical protein|tara:strand:- start:1633 stop:2046 length:414 start_codon:yes stop_codon:yes gene_type:complete